VTTPKSSYDERHRFTAFFLGNDDVNVLPECFPHEKRGQERVLCCGNTRVVEYEFHEGICAVRTAAVLGRIKFVYTRLQKEIVYPRVAPV
jgi:hypothetical protein